MADIKTITEELTISGSSLHTEYNMLTDVGYSDPGTYKSLTFLQKKIDELVAEINNIKDSLE
jgi:phage-related protein